MQPRGPNRPRRRRYQASHPPPTPVAGFDLVTLLIYLVIAGICGAIGQSLVGFNLGGCLVSIVVGFIGAWIGAWLAGKIGLPELLPISVGGRTFPIIWAVLGSAVFALIVGLIRRGSRRV